MAHSKKKWSNFEVLLPIPFPGSILFLQDNLQNRVQGRSTAGKRPQFIVDQLHPKLISTKKGATRGLRMNIHFSLRVWKILFMLITTVTTSLLKKC